MREKRLGSCGTESKDDWEMVVEAMSIEEGLQRE
jgi:hypothetical protein